MPNLLHMASEPVAVEKSGYHILANFSAVSGVNKMKNRGTEAIIFIFGGRGFLEKGEEQKIARRIEGSHKELVEMYEKEKRAWLE